MSATVFWLINQDYYDLLQDLVGEALLSGGPLAKGTAEKLAPGIAQLGMQLRRANAEVDEGSEAPEGEGVLLVPEEDEIEGKEGS